MPASDLQPCPFYGHDAPTLVVMGNENVQRVSVVCTECGAVEPMAAPDDPPAHAEYLRSQRNGANLYITAVELPND